MGNKVEFGLKNVHYAVATEDAEGVITYGTPKRIRGAVELSVEPRGDMTEFYADDVLYYSSSNNNGYDGTLTIARIPQEFAVDVLGDELDEVSGVITERSDAKQRKFALMFEFDGDEKATRQVLYHCSASRPSVTSSTKTETTEPNTNELTFIASPRPSDYKVKTKTADTVVDEVYNAWYEQVFELPEGA